MSPLRLFRRRGTLERGVHACRAPARRAFAAEGTLQRQLAKKLGIKGKKRKAAPLPETDAVEELDTMFAGLCCPCPGW